MADILGLQPSLTQEQKTAALVQSVANQNNASAYYNTQQGVNQSNLALQGGAAASQAALSQGQSQSNAAINAGMAGSASTLAQGQQVSQGQLGNQAAANTAIESPFISGGTSAYDAYLGALGLSYQVTPATAGTPAQAATAGTPAIYGVGTPAQAQIGTATQVAANPGLVGTETNQQGQPGEWVYPNGQTASGGTPAPFTVNTQNIPGMQTIGNGQTAAQNAAAAANNEQVMQEYLATQDAAHGMTFEANGYGATPATTQYSANYAAATPGTQGPLIQAATPGTAAVAATPGTAAVMSTPQTSSQIMAQFQNSPGYQNMLTQGINAANASAASQGLLGSGAQGMALDQYAANYAQNAYQAYLGNLSTAAGVGQTAAGALNTANTGIATTGATLASNAATQGAQNITSLAGTGASNATSLANTGANNATSLANQGSSAAVSAGNTAAGVQGQIGSASIAQLSALGQAQANLLANNRVLPGLGLNMVGGTASQGV